MSAQSRGSSSSSDDSSSEEDRGRLTAAQELRGHLDDCLSLYSSRFLFAQVSLACIQSWKADTPAAREGSSATAQTSETFESPHTTTKCVARDDFDASTVATVVWLRHDVKSSTVEGPLGVVICFQYWSGFTVYAERRYASVSEAQAESNSIKEETWSLDLMLQRASPVWTPPTVLLEARATPEADAWHGDVEQQPGGVPCDGGPSCDGSAECGEEATRYESLMALLVHRYL